MADDNHKPMPQPTRPFMRRAQKYDVLREMSTTQPKPVPAVTPQREEVFSATFIASKEKGVSMDEENKFLIELIFKPNENKLKLRPAETQLLLAHIGEILKEIEMKEEEKLIIKEENGKLTKEDKS